MLTYINIGYINSIIEVLGVYLNKDAKEKLKYIREDIRPIFKDLINNEEEILQVMRVLKVILSRSRAINFIKLRYYFRISNYNFYAKDNIYYIAIFMSYIRSIGVY